FEDEDARALTGDEAIAGGVEGAAGALWVVVARGERVHAGKGRDGHRRHPCLGPARNHHVRVAALDDLRRLTDGMRAGSASRDGGIVVAARAQQHRDIRARQVGGHHRDEEWVEAVGRSLENLMEALLQRPQTTASRADQDADLVGYWRDV